MTAAGPAAPSFSGSSRDGECHPAACGHAGAERRRAHRPGPDVQRDAGARTIRSASRAAARLVRNRPALPPLPGATRRQRCKPGPDVQRNAGARAIRSPQRAPPRGWCLTARHCPPPLPGATRRPRQTAIRQCQTAIRQCQAAVRPRADGQARAASPPGGEGAHCRRGPSV